MFVVQHVRHAVELGAVDVLMLSDDLFRSPSPSIRAQFVALIADVKAAGGVSIVMSSMHVSGEQLSKVCGVAAILRFPLNMDDVDDDAAARADGESSSSSDSSSDDGDDEAVLFRGGDAAARFDA